MILKGSGRTSPIEEFANGLGQFGYAEGGEIVDDIADEFDIFSGKLMTTKRNSRWHGLARMNAKGFAMLNVEKNECDVQRKIIAEDKILSS